METTASNHSHEQIQQEKLPSSSCWALINASSGHCWPRVTIQSPGVPLEGCRSAQATPDGAPAADAQGQEQGHEQEQGSSPDPAQCSAREEPAQQRLQEAWGWLCARCGASAVLCPRAWCPGAAEEMMAAVAACSLERFRASPAAPGDAAAQSGFSPPARRVSSCSGASVNTWMRMMPAQKSSHRLTGSFS